MKKLLALIIIAIIAVYSGLWYHNASNAKAHVETKLHEFAKSIGNSELKYQSLHTSGYPFSYIVTINNPSFASSGMSVSQEGPLSIGTNLFGSKYWIDRSGAMRAITPIQLLSEEGSDEIIKGKNRFTIGVDNAHPIQAFFHPFETFPSELFSQENSMENLWNLLKEAEFYGTEISAFDTQDQSIPVFSADYLHYFLSHKLAPHEREFITVAAEMNGAKFNNAWIKDAPKSPDEDVRLLIENTFDYLARLSGNQGINFSFEGDALIPASQDKTFSWEKLADYPEISFHVKKCDWSSSSGETSLTAALSLNDNKGDRNIHFESSGFSFVNKEGYEIAVQNFVEQINALAQNTDHPYHQFAQKLVACCEADLPKLLPHYDQLGKIKFDHRIDFSNRYQDNENRQTLLTIKPLSIQMDPYSFNLNGETTLNQFSPEGQFLYEIRNVDSAIKDLAAYYNRIHPILIKVVEEQYASFIIPPITEKKVTQILDFVQSFSDNPENKTSNFKTTIQIHGFTDVKIGKKSVLDIVLSGQQLLRDLYQQG